MRDTLNWGRTRAPSPDNTENEEYEGPDQLLEELLMLLREEKDTNTPPAHTIITSIVTSPPPPSPARKTRSCSMTKLSWRSGYPGEWREMPGQLLQQKTPMTYMHPQTPTQQKV